MARIRLSAGERRRCHGCGRELIGAAHARTGKIAPIVLEPTEHGNCLIWRGTHQVEYAVIGDTLVRAYLREARVPLRLNHFADCSEAARFTPRGDPCLKR